MKYSKELGLEERSIIVFTSDHGEMMGSHGIRPGQKQYPCDESVHVPFLISHPNRIGKGGIDNTTGRKLYLDHSGASLQSRKQASAFWSVGTCYCSKNKRMK